jgi:hypothetical protein
VFKFQCSGRGWTKVRDRDQFRASGTVIVIVIEVSQRGGWNHG